MPITVNTVAFTQDSFQTPNKVQYTSPSHNFSEKDMLTLARTAPKPTATYKGVGRFEVKRTKTVTVADGSQKDALVTLNVAFPVGISDADADALVDDVGDWIITAEGKGALRKHDLTF